MAKCTIADVNAFAPFCHGTSSWSVREITKSGMIRPRDEMPSNWGGKFESKGDRVYLGGIFTHPLSGLDACNSAAQEAVKALGGRRFYVLENLPKKFESDLAPDEDCAIWAKELGVKSACETACDSLKVMGTFSVRAPIPLDLFRERPFARYGEVAHTPTEMREFAGRFF